MIKVYCNIDPATKEENGVCVAEGYVNISGDINDLANECRVIIAQLDKKLGADLFAQVLDSWLREEKGF